MRGRSVTCRDRDRKERGRETERGETGTERETEIGRKGTRRD